MRGEKEIREALKRLKDEHLRRIRQPSGSTIYSMLTLVAMIGVLEWVVGDKERLPDIEGVSYAQEVVKGWQG